MIWRRILLRTDPTVADLHYSIPLATESAVRHISAPEARRR
jgi:hypothetical protein